MQSYVRPHVIAFAAALLPGAALVITFILSAQAGHIAWCMPLVDGCTSISGAARNGISLYIFRMLVVPAAVLQLAFWVFLLDWFRPHGQDAWQTARRTLALGVCSVLFLTLYANFLGTEGSVYTFLRRLGIYVYFATTVTAHLLITLNVHRLSNAALVTPLLRGMSLVSLGMLLLALSQAYIKLFVEDHRSIENVIEWNIAIVMHLPFLVFGYYWYKSDYHLHVNQRIPSQNDK